MISKKEQPFGREISGVVTNGINIAKLKISTIFKLSKFSLREGPYMERGYVKVNFFYFGLNFFLL